MGKTTKNPMSEDELLSALGLSVGTAEPKEKTPSTIDDDLLMDALAPESASTKRSSVDAARVRAREEQEREKRLRSQEWRRELEQQQMREAAMAAVVERERAELEQRSARPMSQAAIPNLGEMRDIEDVATIAEEKRRAADEVERRRLAMQAQARRRQEEVAAEARNAVEEARRRAQGQEAAQQMAAARFAARNRSQGNQPLPAQAMQRDPDPTHQVRANQQPRTMGQPQQPSAAMGTQPLNANAKDPRTADAVRQRPAGYSQDLGKPIAAPSTPRPETAPQQPLQPLQTPASYHQTIVQVEAQQEDSRKRAPIKPQSGESPLGIVLIVLAVLCVLVAASLLTGLWDISNL